jgi:hypothetical protein
MTDQYFCDIDYGCSPTENNPRYNNTNNVFDYTFTNGECVNCTTPQKKCFTCGDADSEAVSAFEKANPPNPDPTLPNPNSDKAFWDAKKFKTRNDKYVCSADPNKPDTIKHWCRHPLYDDFEKKRDLFTDLDLCNTECQKDYVDPGNYFCDGYKCLHPNNKIKETVAKYTMPTLSDCQKDCTEKLFMENTNAYIGTFPNKISVNDVNIESLLIEIKKLLVNDKVEFTGVIDHVFDFSESTVSGTTTKEELAVFDKFKYKMYKDIYINNKSVIDEYKKILNKFLDKIFDSLDKLLNKELLKSAIEIFNSTPNKDKTNISELQNMYEHYLLEASKLPGMSVKELQELNTKIGNNKTMRANFTMVGIRKTYSQHLKGIKFDKMLVPAKEYIGLSEEEIMKKSKEETFSEFSRWLSPFIMNFGFIPVSLKKDKTELLNTFEYLNLEFSNIRSSVGPVLLEDLVLKSNKTDSNSTKSISKIYIILLIIILLIIIIFIIFVYYKKV